MNLEKYPKVKQLMENTGMTLEEAYHYVEMECKKKGIL